METRKRYSVKQSGAMFYISREESEDGGHIWKETKSWSMNRWQAVHKMRQLNQKKSTEEALGLL